MQAKNLLPLGRTALRLRHPKKESSHDRFDRLFYLNRQVIYCCAHQGTSSSAVEETPGGGSAKLKVRLSTKERTATTAKKLTSVRALERFRLKNKDLEGLPFEKRHDDHGGPDQKLYLESTILEKAVKVHGSLRNLEKAQKADNWRKEDVAFFVSDKEQEQHRVVMKRSLRVVSIAFMANLTDTCSKLLGWSLTGSHSLFAEFIHSFADTCNQLVVGVGIWLSASKPDKTHPYGYSNLKSITSLISGVGILFIGTGVNVYRGINALMIGAPLEPLSWATGLLAVSLLTQGTTIYKAVREIDRRAKEASIPFREFVKRNHDPGLNVVLMEDGASVVGVMVAGSCILLSHYLASPIPDALGSVIIGGLLATVAVRIVKSNIDQLIGKSIPESERNQMIEHLKKDEMITSLSDVKVTEMGSNKARFKAEVDLCGRAVARAYLKSQDLEALLAIVRSFETKEELQEFLEDHGDNVLNQLGTEIDRIELKFKEEYPQCRHVDLEPL